MQTRSKEKKTRLNFQVSGKIVLLKNCISHQKNPAILLQWNEKIYFIFTRFALFVLCSRNHHPNPPQTFSSLWNHIFQDEV